MDGDHASSTWSRNNGIIGISCGEGSTITTAGEAAHSGARIVVMHGFAD